MTDPAQSSQAQPKTEFVIRVAKKNDLRKWSVLKFNQADNVDPGKWNRNNEVFMEREDNRNVVMSTQTVQEFGEGSEFGKAAREEARRKKYGRQARTYAMDHQPWHLNFVDNNGKERRMNSIREGDGHADYWIFMKQGDEFIATKVDEMHRFTNAIKYKTLDADAAEEAFLKRDRVMNHFVQKAEIRNKISAEEDGEKVSTKPGLKIKDIYSSDESDAERGDDEDGEKEKIKKKKQKSQMKRKDKRQRVDNSEDVAKYESSDGEDEGREQDYMTDSGSDSEREGINVDEKIDKELVGVGDESGLKKMMDSEESESESDDDIMRKILDGDTSKKGADGEDVEDRDSSGSDTDDPDKEKIDSHVFMPINPKKEYVPSANGAEISKKRPAGPEEDGLNPAKKIKTESNEGLNEETVRKYLRRKPHTTKELLSKIKGRCGDLPKSEIVTRLANILKTIEPQQFKQKQGKKDVLFFSLGNQMPR